MPLAQSEECPPCIEGDLYSKLQYLVNQYGGQHLLPQHAGDRDKEIYVQGHLQLHGDSEAILGYVSQSRFFFLSVK